MPSNEDLLRLARVVRNPAIVDPGREARLARLAEEIRSGKYTVDTEALADRLMREFERNDETDEER